MLDSTYPVGEPCPNWDQGCVYFIRHAEDGPIKIGWTNHPFGAAPRLETLQVGNPYPLRIIGSRIGPRSDETKFHKRFAAQRIQGEWFEPTDELLRFALEENVVAEADRLFPRAKRVPPPPPGMIPALKDRPGKWRTVAPSSEVTVRRVDPATLKPSR